MSLDHLKQFLITVLDAKLVMIVSISISSNIPFSMPDANFLLEDMWFDWVTLQTEKKTTIDTKIEISLSISNPTVRNKKIDKGMCLRKILNLDR